MRRLYPFNVFDAIPLDGEIAYADVAEKIGPDRIVLKALCSKP